MRKPSFCASLGVLLVAALLLAPCSCRKPASAHAAARPGAPNVVWILWDTVRADRLGVYGYGKPTTPHLSEWARGARVFENCLSTSCWTVPSHGAMFTGLLPSEHGAHHDHPVLDETHQTIAEILRHNGYQTYLFSANPHVSALMNFQQGFDDCDHPWDEDHREQALELVRGKIAPADRSTELSESLSSGPVDAWHLKASGELGRQGLEAWLEERDPQRPFFAFLNYMEAHWPLLPQERFRRQVMDPGTMRESYEVDHSWLSMWKYVFGFQEYSARQLEVISATYDACIAELDVLFYDLMQSLEARGLLENTIIIVTSDHGEHLGEHRLMDHQFSLYEPLIRVPLLVRAPGRLEPGREARPVMNYDLFPTLLELCGVAQPEGLQSQAVSLLAPLEHRQRFAEYPSTMRTPIEKMSQLYSGWDPSPWQRRLRVLVEEPYKYIVGSDGRQELYDIAGDPAELRDLMSSQPEIARRMAAALNDYLRKLRLHAGGKAPSKQMTPIEREVMRSLGYVDD